MRKAVVRTTPWYKRVIHFFKYYKHYPNFPNGHFYSPVTDVQEVKEQESFLWQDRSPEDIKGIDFNESEQLRMLDQIRAFYDEIPFKGSPNSDYRYYFDNPQFSYADGIVLYGILRALKPKKVIEIGAGHSSALMLDVNEKFLDRKMLLSFIEPYPKRLEDQLKSDDYEAIEIINKRVQFVTLSEPEKLNSGDILFIDSSHVLKTGSDLQYLFFEWIPRLKSGVIIHIHDIFYPFEYPKEWALNGRNWNEIYFLRALLTNNDRLKILFFSDYIQQKHAAKLNSMPLYNKSRGGSIWLKVL